MVIDMMSRTNWFVVVLSHFSSEECKFLMLIYDMGIAGLMIYVQ